MTLSPYGRAQWLTITLVALGLSVAAALWHWWWALALVVALALALLSFFRDPHRLVPTQRGLMVSPADGLVSSIHELADYPPLGGPAVCVRVFLSVLDVHVNRAPCHGQVASVEHTPGKYLNALNPRSAECNAAALMVLVNPATRRPVAAVRQVAGAIARTIVCAAQIDQILQRGQRYGMIKFGSTTELYLPLSASPKVQVRRGQRVYGGLTVLAQVAPTSEGGTATAAEPTAAEPVPAAAPHGD